MRELNLKKLQNGSDIRGVSLSGIKGEDPNLTDVHAPLIAGGFLLWLCDKTGKRPDELKISIGRDPRLSGQMLLSGLIRGFGPYGVTILDCGLSSTPAMFMSTVFEETACDGAIMITASHLPFNRNGFKFFTRNGGLDKKDISAILEYAEQGTIKDKYGEGNFTDNMIKILGKPSYPVVKFELLDLYASFLRKTIIEKVNIGDRPLSGLKIMVDAGNGSGGFYAHKVLAPLGADISSGQFLEPDGTFPNHAPNPEDKEALSAASLQVISQGADFGLIFDTDVDRSAAIDGRGHEIARNGIVAMAAALVCEDHPDTWVVTDSITSTHLTDYLEKELGMKHMRYKRGYKNVINKGIELNENGEECWLAIETSGHAALKENYFLDDGAYLATKIVIKAACLKKEGRTIDSIIEGLVSPAEAKEVRMPITCDDFSSYGDMVLSEFEKWASTLEGAAIVTPNYEGVRVVFEHGWCLLRKSLHDPLLPLNIESDISGGTSMILEKIDDFLSRFEYLA